MKKKIGMVSLGCPKNLIDSEIMLGLLQQSCYEIIHDKEEAQILIVNTCGFIESAKKESIDTIIEMAACKKNQCELLIVTGCLAQRYQHEIIKEIPEVDAVVGTGNYAEIVSVIEKAYAGEKSELYGKLDDVEYLQNQRLLTEKKGSAYLKIAEGCDNFCTYCVIPSLRGRYRSRKMEDILAEARDLSSQGVKEIILVAQDTTRYGKDFNDQGNLVTLIQKLSEIEDIRWIRLLYCYPEEIHEDLIHELAVNDKLCKYLDIPIQHSSDTVLKKMGRRGTSKELRDLILKLRKNVPEIVIRTSIIVGFPGEEEKDFEDLVDFVRKCKFDRLGVFMYSKEEGTKAAKMKPQVLKSIKKKRHDHIMAIQNEIHAKKNVARSKKNYRVLVEGIAEDGIFYTGRTYAEAPDIDGIVYFTSQEPLEIGEFVTIKILNFDGYDLIGEVIYEFTK